MGLRKFINRKKPVETGPTWGCGYTPADSKLQYTANSFVRSYSKLAKPLLDIEKKEVEIAEVFPSEKHYETDSYDKIERILIDKPIKLLNKIHRSVPVSSEWSVAEIYSVWDYFYYRCNLSSSDY